MATLASMTVFLNADIKQFTAEMGKATKGLGGMEKLAGGMGMVGKTAAMALGGVAVAGLASLGLAAKSSLDDFVDFESGMTEVFTLMPGMTKSARDKMSADMLGFAKDMGVLPEQAIPALYQAISAGVPADNVFSFLKTAQQAAVGGVTTIETAVDGVSSVVNAYGQDVLSAQQASDTMFTAVRLGKTTFEELSKSLFNVTPVAASMGVGFDQVTAALAALTAQGVPTSVATTQLRQMFIELGDSGAAAGDYIEKTAGKSFSAFISSGGTLAEALKMVSDGAKDDGFERLGDVFGSVEAGMAATSLFSATDTLVKNLDEMGKNAGATGTAFETMNETSGRSMEMLQSRFAAMKLEWADKMAPALDKFLGMIVNFGNSPEFAKMWDGFLGATTVVVDWVTMNGPKIFDGLMGAFNWLSENRAVVVGVLTALGVAMTVFGVQAAIAGWMAISPFLPVIGILAGIGLAVGLLYQAWTTNFGGIQEKTAAVWEWLKGAFATGLQFVQDLFGGKLGWFSEMWANTWNTITTIFSTWWENIKLMFALIGAVFEGDWRKVGEILRQIWDNTWAMLKTVFKNGIDNIVLFVKNFPKTVFDFMKSIDWGKLGLDIIKGIANGLLAGPKILFDAVSAVGNAVMGMFQGFFDIKSPSRVMKVKVGYQLAAGIADGLTMGAGALIPGSVGAVNDKLSGFGGRGRGAGGVVVNINVSGGGSDNELARKIGQSVRLALRQEGLV